MGYFYPDTKDYHFVDSVRYKNDNLRMETDTLRFNYATKKSYFFGKTYITKDSIDIESNFFSLMNAINDIAMNYNIPILYSCHPRSKKNIEKRGFKFHKNVILNKPLGFFDYNKLQKHAFCVVSDSGTLPEESAYLNFPAISIRTSTERPEAMDKGVFIIGSITKHQILQAVNMAVEMYRKGDGAGDVPAYADENVSTKVVKLVQSYTGVVNKMVWRKIE